VVAGAPAAPAAPAAKAVLAPRSPSADTNLVPQSDAEREAVRATLQQLRRKSAAEDAAPARVTVRLPAEARLWVEGEACPLTSATRSFLTPQLQPGQQYAYTMRAEVVRDGQTISQTRRVVIAAGREVDVTFSNFTPAAVTQR
jgi:uncharacterized protein (TIGR03000 family)